MIYMIKVLVLVGMLSMASDSISNPVEGVTQRPFGQLPSGQIVTEYTLSNGNGMLASILDYGGIIRALVVPDRGGTVADIVLGFDTLDSYAARHPYFGAIVGRYAGRIGKGKFSLDGTQYTLATNNGDNHLHGGIVGFDRAVWSVEVSESPARLVLRHVSPDGDEGYPGTLSVQVTYTLSDDALYVEYVATADAPTIINLTQHTYFNLAGLAVRDVLGHELRVRADAILELGEGSIPTGSRLSVFETPFDFREPKVVGRDIGVSNRQLQIPGGYDHTWILTGIGEGPDIVLSEPTSGRRLEIFSDQPGVQIYMGNYLDGSIIGKGGERYAKYAGIALETQHFPDSPNHPEFPSTVLRPGETFRSQTEFRFSVYGDPPGKSSATRAGR